MDYKDLKAGHTHSSFWARGKRDLIGKQLSRLNKSDMKILSLGVGTGDELEVLNKFGNVYIIDINKKALDLIPKNLYHEKKISDACNLDYKNNFFDLVVAFDVFEHIPDDKLAVKEAYRVLKKRGYLVFSVPAFQSLYSSHDLALEHKRRYSKKMLNELLQNFSSSDVNYWNSILFPILALIRLKNKNSPPKVDSPNLPLILDNLLFYILKLENFLIRKGFKFPFGLSLIGISQK